MKTHILLFLLLLTQSTNAQDYKCVRRNEIPYFINADGYLRGMRIDNITTAGADTFLHPYQTDRSHIGPPPPGIATDEGSWFGSSIVQRPDGNFHFNTIWNGIVFVKTRAQPGDSWPFYTDTTARRYVATVVSVDTMTFAGITDSVKTIRIAAYLGTAINPDDSINGFEMVISKSHGFVRTFDLYLFPYHSPAGVYYLDFYQLQIGTAGIRNSIFTRTDYHVPTRKEIYDFSNGDVFISSGWTLGEFPERSWHYYDSIISKTVLDPWRIIYRVYRIESTTTSYAASPGGPTYHSYGGHEIDFLADTTRVFNASIMPEEKIVPTRVWYYRPADTTWCGSGSYYKTDDIVTFEGGPNRFEYKTGFEQLFEETHTSPYQNGEIGYHSIRQSKLLFAIKNGIPCGIRSMPVPTGVNDLHYSDKTISIYPNPVASVLHVVSWQPMQELSITDISGRRVYSYSGGTMELDIEIGKLPTGVYVIKIDGNIHRFVKE